MHSYSCQLSVYVSYKWFFNFSESQEFGYDNVFWDTDILETSRTSNSSWCQSIFVKATLFSCFGPMDSNKVILNITDDFSIGDEGIIEKNWGWG